MIEIFIQDIVEGINEFESEISSNDIQIPDNHYYNDTIYLKVFIDKIECLLRVKIEISTEAKYVCDRCLDEYKGLFHEKIEQLFQIGHSELDSDDDIKILPSNAKEIDLSDVISEAFLIHRPFKLLCNANCKGLCSKCGSNLNQKSCNCMKNEIDPRLEKLKTFLS